MKGSDFPLLLASELICSAGACFNPEPSFAPPQVSARTAAHRQDSAQPGAFPRGAEAMVTGVSVQDLTPPHGPPALRSVWEILQHPQLNLPHPKSWQMEKQPLVGAHYGMGFKQN